MTSLNWRETSVVVTGGAGFLGQEIQSKLKERGAQRVFIPRRADYDLTDNRAVERLFDDARPDLVLHLAAEVGGIGANIDNPGRFFYANMAMGLHLIEQARIRSLPKFVQVGTICAYPNHTPVPFQEENLWDGYPEPTNAPYGIAKKSLLVMLQSYRAQYGLNGIFLLPVNLYGPNDNFDLQTSHVIPAMIRKFVTARDAGHPSVTLWGTGRASREFLFVRDCAEGILLASERYEGAEPVNLGTNLEITIRDLAGKIRSLTGYTGEIVWDESKPDGQPRRCLDTSRAKAEFDFVAQTSFDDGLRETIEWWEEQG